jgi:hypothetical protein
MPQPGQHASASQRKIAHLEAINAHYLQVISVLVAQSNGMAVVPHASLLHDYDLTLAIQPSTHDVFFTSKVKTPPAAPTADETQPIEKKEADDGPR